MTFVGRLKKAARFFLSFAERLFPLAARLPDEADHFA